MKFAVVLVALLAMSVTCVEAPPFPGGGPCSKLFKINCLS